MPMKKLFLVFLFLFLITVFPAKTFAIYDPLSIQNNKIGVHILFPSELAKANELVNSTGGDWGYVIIPIQAGDKDIKKWQNFMDEAKSLHLIPVIRLATEGDFFQKESWKKPKDEDVIDFANFLDSLNWPVKNRYIIAFNEVNRADEWEGEANPEEYAQILSFTSSTFKSKNPDYYIISSGMDNAAATGGGTYSQYDYFQLMDEAIPGIFNQIDAFSSHSYPNPAFSEPPTSKTRQSISSFIYEKNLIDSLTDKNLPVFISETGWDQTVIPEKQAGEYFKYSFENIWNDKNIVMVSPFLLKAGMGPFEKFSLIKNDGNKNEVFKSIEGYGKVAGKPVINPSVKLLSEETSNVPIKTFPPAPHEESGEELRYFVKWLLVPL